MILAYFHIKQRDTLTRVYCSELVAAAYQAMGLLANDRAAADYLPSDFAHEGSRAVAGAGRRSGTSFLPRCFDRQRNSKLQLEGGAALTSKIVVAFESASALNIAMQLVASNASEHEAMRQLYARKVIRKFVARVAERRRAEAAARAAPEQEVLPGEVSIDFE